MKKLKEFKGITLVALVITIILLLILAGISIQAITNQGLFGRANEAKQASEIANIKEKIQLDIYEKQLETLGKDLTDGELATILKTYGTPIFEEDGTTIKGITTEKGYEILLSDIYSGSITETEVETPPTLLADGSWNNEKEVNSPKLMQGMTGIYWDADGNEVTVTAENQDNWYDYNGQKWANAKTEDGSYWVWIPRYAYQIESGCYTSTAGTISVKFLQGTTNKDKDGNTLNTTYPTVTSGKMQDYVVHPCFTNGTENKFMNGEWDAEIPGFWVAKYPAGFQANTITNNNGTLSTTISNSSDTVVYSNKYYTSYNSNSNCTTNALSQTLSSKPQMSYPVFKPLTYVYNNISTGDAYTLSQEIKNGSSFYGLSSSETDSHQMKNSEWGAVAYLTQSSCGRSGTEVNINNYYTSESSPYRTAITGVYANSTNADKTTTLGNAYNTTVGVKGSSTANITGVYDLNGCVWERTAGYITNGNSYLSTYGSSYVAKTTADTNGYKTLSTKYATVYPYNSSDSDTNNWTVYKNAKTSTYGFGDAILEISALGGSTSDSWSEDYSSFAHVKDSFFVRGGNYTDGSDAGAFAFRNSYGDPYYSNGFRAVLVGV